LSVNLEFGVIEAAAPVEGFSQKETVELSPDGFHHPPDTPRGTDLLSEL
jgi:hypothetical protein